MFTCKTAIMPLCLNVGLQDPYNMERVFWLLLGRDGASVKNMMEEFQQSHRHSLLENHRKLVPVIQHILYTSRRACPLTCLVRTHPPSNTLMCLRSIPLYF